MNPTTDSFPALADALTAGLWRGLWQGSAAFLLVWAICRFVPRLPASWRCWLWRLALARLLFALFFPASLPLPLLSTPSVPSDPAPMILPAKTAAPVGWGFHPPPMKVDLPRSASPARLTDIGGGGTPTLRDSLSPFRIGRLWLPSTFWA